MGDILNSLYARFVGPDSSVGTATRYGLDAPGIESRCDRDFPFPARPTLGPTQPPIQLVPVIFHRGKAHSPLVPMLKKE